MNIFNRVPLIEGMTELGATSGSCYDDAMDTFNNQVKEERVESSMN